MPFWNGTQAEASEFIAAAINNCECVRGTDCATHRAFKTDQKFLDDLVFYRRLRDRLKAE